MSFEFIWRAKDRIKRNILYQNYGFGGIKISNYMLFVKSQRIMWLKRLIYGEKDSGWKNVFLITVVENLEGDLLYCVITR